MSKEQFLSMVRLWKPGVEILSVATVLREGWEMDNYVALVSLPYPTEPFLVSTDHGRLTRSMDIEDLKEQKSLMQDAVRSVDKLLELMAGPVS